MFGRRGPGLVRAAATTAVVAGTAGAVRHRQEQRYARQDQEAYEQELAAQAAYQQQMAAQAAPPPPAAEADPYAEIEKLAKLKDQGIISDAEFDAKKKQLLGL
jgi:hypothetical protein